MNTQHLDATITTTLAAWQIPGAAVALMQGAESFAAGYGVRAIGEPAAVDADTIFAIGSTTKAFTAALMGMLVDEGKVGWDDPVTQHLPDFALYDPWVTRHVTVRDLLCHRLGLERAQRLYYHRGYSQRDLMRRMQYLKPIAGFRAQFHYANQQYGVAGLLIEMLTGQTWDDCLSEKIFAPLHMTHSASSYNRVTEHTNLAAPHAVLDETYPASVRFLGAPSVIPNYQLSHEPAGSVHTCANDLLRWLRTLLQDGAPLLQPTTFAELTTPQIVMQNPANSELAPLYVLQPATRFWTYGLGWWVMDYHGEKVLMHGGQMPGFNSVVAFYPERRIGLALMVNVHQTLAHAALFYALSDILLDQPSRDWSGQFRTVAQGYMAEVKQQADVLRRTCTADVSLAPMLASYAGTFANDLYGDMTVTLEDDHLWLTYGQLVATLVPCQPATFIARWHLKGLLDDALVAFTADARTLVTDGAEYRRRS